MIFLLVHQFSVFPFYLFLFSLLFISLSPALVAMTGEAVALVVATAADAVDAAAAAIVNQDWIWRE